MSSTLCKEEDDRLIKIEFYKSQKNGKHVNLGFSDLNLQILKSQEKTKFNIEHIKGNDVKGTLIVNNFFVQKRHTFLEYVFGGCEISLAIAVDFTLSNGYPHEQQSLHYFDLNRNEYLQAI